MTKQNQKVDWEITDKNLAEKWLSCEILRHACL